MHHFRGLIQKDPSQVESSYAIGMAFLTHKNTVCSWVFEANFSFEIDLTLILTGFKTSRIRMGTQHSFPVISATTIRGTG